VALSQVILRETSIGFDGIYVLCENTGINEDVNKMGTLTLPLLSNWEATPFPTLPSIPISIGIPTVHHIHRGRIQVKQLQRI